MDKSKFKSKVKVENTKKEELNPEVELLKSQLVRSLADYDNLRKRTEEEKSLWIRFSSQRVLTTLLPILDNFESAQKHLNDSGLAIAIGEFKKVFVEEGLEEIVPKVDDTFDHIYHEAVETVETEDDNRNGKISDLVLTGWKFKDIEGLEEGRGVIRHAKVKVYKKI
jgi:molecular chaperone GrpE